MVNRVIFNMKYAINIGGKVLWGMGSLLKKNKKRQKAMPKLISFPVCIYKQRSFEKSVKEQPC